MRSEHKNKNYDAILPLRKKLSIKKKIKRQQRPNTALNSLLWFST